MDRVTEAYSLIDALSLTERERLVLARWLYDRPRPTAKELGREFGISEGGIRIRIARAKRKVRAALSNTGYPDRLPDHRRHPIRKRDLEHVKAS